MNSSEANKENIAYWEGWYKDHPMNRENIVFDDWMWTFSKIIEEARGPVIDLGCGEGNDTLYMLNKGKKVIPCDGSMNAILDIRKNFPEIREEDARCFDFLSAFPFCNNATDLLVADLSLHYFTREDTIKILKEIKRVLTNQGHMFARVNSLDDVNFGAGQGVEVEPHLYMKDGRLKRFFDSNDIYDYFRMFDMMYVRKEPMKRYSRQKETYVVGVRNRK